MALSGEIYEYAWDALAQHAQSGLRLFSPREISPHAYDEAATMLEAAPDEDLLERAFLREVLQNGLLNLPPEMPRIRNSEGLQMLGEVGKNRLAESLGKAGLMLALPDFYRDDKHRVILGQLVALSQTDLYYFTVEEQRTRRSSSFESGATLLYRRLLHAVTAPELAWTLAGQANDAEHKLIMGPAAVNEYLTALARAEQAAPGSTPQAQWLAAGQKVGLDLLSDLDPEAFPPPPVLSVPSFRQYYKDKQDQREAGRTNKV